MANPQVSTNTNCDYIIINHQRKIKFTPVNLYRHSQFDTSKNASTSDATTTTTTDSSEPTTSTANVRQSNNATNIKPETVSTNDSVRSAHVPATTSSAPQSIPRYQPLIPEDGFSYGNME